MTRFPPDPDLIPPHLIPPHLIPPDLIALHVVSPDVISPDVISPDPIPAGLTLRAGRLRHALPLNRAFKPRSQPLNRGIRPWPGHAQAPGSGALAEERWDPKGDPR